MFSKAGSTISEQIGAERRGGKGVATEQRLGVVHLYTSVCWWDPPLKFPLETTQTAHRFPWSHSINSCYFRVTTTSDIVEISQSM